MVAIKTPLIVALLLALAVSGCVSKSTDKARAQAAFMAGRQQSLAIQNQGPSVWFTGNVKYPVVAWTPDLTLAKAILAAEYQGIIDPMQITIIRDGQPISIAPRSLLMGHDVPLESGDRIEIQP